MTNVCYYQYNKLVTNLGMTLGKIIIDLSEKEFASGLTYTAVTRVRRAADMSFRPFPNFIRY